MNWYAHGEFEIASRSMQCVNICFGLENEMRRHCERRFHANTKLLWCNPFHWSLHGKGYERHPSARWIIGMRGSTIRMFEFMLRANTQKPTTCSRSRRNRSTSGSNPLFSMILRFAIDLQCAEFKRSTQGAPIKAWDFIKFSGSLVYCDDDTQA